MTDRSPEPFPLGHGTAAAHVEPEDAARARPVTVAGGDAALRVRRSLEEHFSLVWRSVRRLGVPQASLDDAVQQVFLAFTRHIDGVARDRERAFLLGVAVRVAANARRKARRSPEVASDALDRQASLLGSPEQLLDWKQRREALDRALGELPFDQRAVFVLFELEGFSLPEIAESLGVPVGTATSRLRRARAAFQRFIELRYERGDDHE